MITFFRNIFEGRFVKDLKSWIVTGLLLIVVISMTGLFGLGSMTSMWGKEQTAIKVGSSTVKGQELLRSVEKETRRIAQMTGNRNYLSIKDAVKMGFLDKIIQNNVASLLYQEIADDLGLIASDQAVSNYIVNNANFQTITGSFDRSLMMAYLQQTQMSEDMFVKALQEELTRKHLTDAIEAVISVPDMLKSKMFDYLYETRDIEAILLPTTAVKVTTNPNKETLQTYYEAMEEQLYAPEYRVVSILKLTPDKVVADIKIDDDSLKAMYEERKETYTKPERRHVEQIIVDTKEKADALYTKLTPDNFAQIAKDEANQDKIDLGWIEKRGVVEEIGESAFNAPINQVLPPVQSMFGYHILVVREIEAAQQTPFEKAKADLIKAVQAEKAYDLLYAKSKQLDEALGEGLSLTDAANRIGGVVDEAIAIDASGIDKNGKPSNLPTELVQDIFLSKSGDSTALHDYQNGFIVAQLLDIEPVYLKPFDAVQKELKDEWVKDQQKKLAPEFAQKVLNNAQKDKNLKTVALFHHLESKALDGVKRADVDDLPANIVAQLFDAKENDFQLIDLGDNSYVIAQVKKIIPADTNDTVAQMNLTIGLKQQMSSSIIDEILAFYGNKENVQINQAVIDETFQPYMKAKE